MKVICLANELTREQKQKHGIDEEDDFQYPFDIGHTYTVLGMSNNLHQGGAIILDMPYFYVFPTPLCLFNIVDDRPSKYWKIKKIGEYEIAFCPEEFSQKYFNDDLSEGIPEVVKIYKKVVERLEKEFD